MDNQSDSARGARILPIVEIARSRGLSEDDLELYGKYKAKVPLDALKRLDRRANGKYVVVTSITPTHLGEGNTTTAIGLAMGMNRLGYKTGLSLRQASLGPVFGFKGGAAGGGRAQVLPFEDVNLHLTGDHHATAVAHNLLSAFVDNSIFHGNPCDIDPFSLSWRRVIDVSDRTLRRVLIGLGGRENGVPRETGFDIVALSEVMAVLMLANGDDDRSALLNLRERLGRIVVGTTRRGDFVSADQLCAAGAMTVLLKDAYKPNLLQTIENTPAFVHGGTFGHIAPGASSILADRLALKLDDYVITEAGFGSDLGMEKFLDVKCRYSGLTPSAVVLVVTLRALKMHGGAATVLPGRALPAELEKENRRALERGAGNLVKHIENGALFGLPVVVAINHFPSDSDRELGFVEQVARDAGAEGAYLSDVYARGGAGAISLGEAVAHACTKPSRFKFLYHEELPIKDKIERIVTQVYGGDGADFSPAAEASIKRLTELGYGKLPVSMVKTHLSLSDDPKLKGRPRGFRVPICDVKVATGAGFIYPFCGDIRTMPGLPSVPAGTKIGIDSEGRTVGLF